MILLVCEGACNGGMVKLFDDAVREAGRIEVPSPSGRDVKTSGVSEDWLSRARRFVHTPHAVHGDRTANCHVCGAERRWA